MSVRDGSQSILVKSEIWHHLLLVFNRYNWSLFVLFLPILIISHIYLSLTSKLNRLLVKHQVLGFSGSLCKLIHGL